MAKAKRQAKLTKTSVQALVAEGKEYFVWDTELTGFGVRVYPSGSKAFVFNYRRKGAGKQGRIDIGKFGQIAVDQAREAAKRYAAQRELSQEVGPERRTGLTVADLCDLWIKEASSYHRRTRMPRSQRSVQNDLIAINRHIKPMLGKQRADDVTAANIDDLVKRISKKELPSQPTRTGRGYVGPKGGATAAKKAAGTLRSVYAYALDRRLVKRNPVQEVKLPADGKRTDYLAPDEISRLVNWLATKGRQADRTAADALLLMVFTGCRPSEVVCLQWDEVRLDEQVLRLKDSKTGPRGVPLIRQAVKLLEERGTREGQFVFPSARKANACSQTYKRLWRKACVDLSLRENPPYVIRHSYSSFLSALKLPDLTIQKLMGHAQIATTQLYTHSDERGLLDALKQFEDKIEEFIS